MTTIFCSNKLKDFVGQKQLTSVENFTENKFGDWNGHLFYCDRRKYLIFVNSKSYYSLIFADVKKINLKDFETFFLNRLIEQLIFDKVIDNSNTLIVLQKLLPLKLTKTNNDKKALGTLNDFVFQFKCNRESPYWSDKSIVQINNSINDSLTGAGRNKDRDYGRPIHDMQELLNS